MATPIDDILQRLRALQDEIEDKIDTRRAALSYRVEQGRITFEAEVRARHRAAQIRLGTFLRNTPVLVMLTVPVIYALLIPFVLLDLFVTVYQAVCFPIYGIAKVRRRDYIAIDRHQLAYLNAVQKLNCVYCGYCNGLTAYVREIAGRTEQYWCPIKHARRVKGTHDHYARFPDYGDAETYQARLQALRDALRDLETPRDG
ncbi:hypothetical protein EOM89_06085 [Candidatus Falkowbacteria bacterium]|nr:hypothetical protein [Candidatus Falkowbacteria bacterium]